jgi:hypothetical protein
MRDENTMRLDNYMNTRLCDIADIRSGHPFRGTIESQSNGDAHVVQVRDAALTGEIFQDRMITTTLTGRKQPDWLKTGDVLFVAKGAKHFAALVEDLPENTVCSPHFFLVRLTPAQQEKALPEFICWQLNQLPAQRYFQTSAEGSMYVSIRRQVLETTPIVLPSIERQYQLAAMYRCAVKERKIFQKLIDSRQQQLEAIAINELCTKYE